MNRPKALSILEELLRYWKTNSGRGHTTALTAGCADDDTRIIVASDNEQAKVLKRMGCRKVITLLELEQLPVLTGRHDPLVIDHYPLSLLVWELLSYISSLENCNDRLEKDMSHICEIVKGYRKE